MTTQSIQLDLKNYRRCLTFNDLDTRCEIERKYDKLGEIPNNVIAAIQDRLECLEESE